MTLKFHYKTVFLRFPDGIFTIEPPGLHEVKTYCDFSADGGPWTLLLTSRTHTGWDGDNVKQRNIHKPSLNEDFSILGFADAIKDFDKSQVTDVFFVVKDTTNQSLKNNPD